MRGYRRSLSVLPDAIPLPPLTRPLDVAEVALMFVEREVDAALLSAERAERELECLAVRFAEAMDRAVGAHHRVACAVSLFVEGVARVDALRHQAAAEPERARALGLVDDLWPDDA
jgi:hypothetical protein